MNHLEEVELFHKHKLVLQLLLGGDFHVNSIKEIISEQSGSGDNQISKTSVGRAIKDLSNMNFVEFKKEKNKHVYFLTENGRQVASLVKIKEEFGYSGEKWAETYHKKGYNVRILSDLTGNPRHKKWVFAWHPITKDMDLVRNMGLRSVKNEENKSGYRAQYVDRSIDKEKPVRDVELFSYISNKLGSKWDEDSLSEVLKEFWDIENHNSFVCLFLPTNGIDFALPSEIGKQGLITFLGVGHQKEFPYIPRLSVCAGGFNMSENLKVNFTYEANLMELKEFCKLIIKNAVFPGSVSKEDVKCMFSKSFSRPFAPEIGIACVNSKEDKETCRKMGVKCMALTDNGPEFNKCHILQNDPLFSD